MQFLRPAEGPLLMVARAQVPRSNGWTVLAVRFVDEAYVEWTAGKVGLPLAVFSASEIEAGSGDPIWILRRKALLRPDVVVAGNVEQQDAHVAVAPLADLGGTIVAVVEAGFRRTSPTHRYEGSPRRCWL